MDYFFNDPHQVVDQMLEGLARLAPVQLTAPEAGMRILAQIETGRQPVAVISGGGAGHEPAHAGFVGRGMLDAAVSGEIFASPSVAAVLAAIRHCGGREGTLLIVKNYTGDRLNFGLAAEQARREGLQVRMVIVSDDIALPGARQPRGLAGTILVHKFAGYLAAQGLSLDDVANRTETLARELMSLGMALSSATLPGHHPEPRSAELGLGIHNEPGVHQVAPQNAGEAVAAVLDLLLKEADRRHGADARLIVLLNDLGHCSSQELSVLTAEVLERIGVDRIALMVRPDRLMTSLDMHGFSITLLPAQADFVAAMQFPVQAPAWPGTFVPHPIEVLHLPQEEAESADHTPGLQSAEVAAMMQRAADALLKVEDQLNELDSRSGDGDAGSTFAAGAGAIARQLQAKHLSTGEPGRLSGELGQLLTHAMGGSSGVLLSILFTAAGVRLDQGDDWSQALEAGVARMQHYGGASLGDRTMLDALIPAIRALPHLAAAAQAARAGARHTATLGHAGAGRAAHVPEHALLGAVDPGAEAIAIVFEALSTGA